VELTSTAKVRIEKNCESIIAGSSIFANCLINCLNDLSEYQALDFVLCKYLGFLFRF